MDHMGEQSQPEQSTAQQTDDEFVDWQCFAYLTVEKSELYRAIIDVFAAAKSEFALHLRPAQVRSGLSQAGFEFELSDIESALQSLEVWGNLQSYQDNADVASLADYYRKRLLYQLTAAGEAAHASTLTFTQRLQQQAKLDARALDRIAEGAGQLERIANQLIVNPDEVDPVVVLTTVRSICQDADELTSRAQSFFRWLHEQTESEKADLKSFLSYKERLIEYLQDFVSQLIAQGAVIASRFNAIKILQLEQMTQLVAQEEMGNPRVGEEELHQQKTDTSAQRWLHRMLGLQSWFSRRGGRAAQLDQLRAAARASIPRLLQLASQMNERQAGHSDRIADLHELATRFIGCRNDAEAHRLFRASFALSSSRHLKIDQATIDFRDQSPTPNSTRWLDADPVEFSPQLRRTGRIASAPANRRIVDRTRQRAEATRRLSLESGRTSSAQETLIALGKCRLSMIGELDQDAFRLLMELIELAVEKPRSKATRPTGRITAFSRDGVLQIKTEPVVDDSPQNGIAPVNGKKHPAADGEKYAILNSHFTSLPESMHHQQYSRVPIAKLKTKTGTVFLPDMLVEVSRV
jgi:uncharacterized protein (TIGR02677 family)